MLTEEEFELVQQILSGKAKPKPQKHEFALNGFVRCGECGMAITAEKHTKTYKSGKMGEFVYYRCTKKGKTCSQQFIREKDLEQQVLETLSGMELDPEWVAFANKWAMAVEQEEIDRQGTFTKAIRNGYDASVRRVNNLMDSLASTDDPELREQINKKLKEEMATKKKYMNQLNGIDNRFDESVDLTVKTIMFASRARERFATGTLQDKKIIVQAVGSNLILKDKKLTLEPRKPFLILQDRLQQIDTMPSSLEPNKKVLYIAPNCSLESKNSVMRG